MILPTPKFNIGDRVYFVYTRMTNRQLPCPDCLGTKKWKAVSPAGFECTATCPRCVSYHYDLPRLDVPYYEISVRKLTVGSVQINTADYDNAPVKYMCRETGVGSGSIYKECDLFTDESEATAAATEKANAQTAKAQAEPDALQARHFSTLRMEDACFERMRSAIFNSWYSYGELLTKLEGFLKDEITKDDLRSEVDFEKRYRQKRSSHPFDVLIRAANKHADDPEIAKAIEPFLRNAEDGTDEMLNLNTHGYDND